jgi:hypothetical protein
MSQNFNSIFQNISDTSKTSDEVIDSKMSGRADALKISTTYEDFKEDTTEKEIKLRKDEREKRFKDRRLQQQIKVEVGQTLKDKMTVAKDIYEECMKMKVAAEDLPNFILQFKSEDLKTQYIGLVGIRKILAIRKNIFLFLSKQPPSTRCNRCRTSFRIYKVFRSLFTRISV